MSAEYEHAGEWDCDICGQSFEAERKLDVLGHVLAGCPSCGAPDRAGGHEGYRRRKRELEAARGEACG
ncbi:hypothetical protein [Natronosalvus halobius]|uniref:hypothetical protein n=1 Tax=Natronosalvus halobius TaxID=2953746 RepID=UPI00209D9607|nr:hypothetical protein [Natronosalvus halobius]USZ73779.1 hypothetical protein NGM15_18405 [Natronosalvus halobius]